MRDSDLKLRTEEGKDALAKRSVILLLKNTVAQWYAPVQWGGAPLERMLDTGSQAHNIVNIH
jgi:hypothetical protein